MLVESIQVKQWKCHEQINKVTSQLFRNFVNSFLLLIDLIPSSEKLRVAISITPSRSIKIPLQFM